MEVELVRFIGAGLAHASRQISDADAPFKADGLDLVRHLATGDDPALISLLTDAAGKIYRSWRSMRVPDAVAVDHLRSLHSILTACNSDRDPWTAILSSSSQVPGGPSSREAMAREIASGLVEQASSNGTLHRMGLAVPVSLVLIEALFVTVFEHIETIRAIAPRTTKLYASKRRTSSIFGEAEKVQLAEVVALHAKSPCPAPLLGALAAQQCQAGLAPDAVAAELHDLARLAAQTLAIIAELKKQAGDTNFAGMLEKAQHDFATGNFTSLNEFFGQTCDAAIKTLSSSGPNEWAFQFHNLRAGLAECMLDWESAAHNFGLARRQLDASDVMRRRETMRSQVSALTNLGEASASSKPYLEAVQICIQMTALVQEFEAPQEWARAHVTAGALLLRLAESENRPDRYAPAALHFRPAIATLSRLNAHDDWGLAQLGLAEALRGQGQVQGDPDMLADAVFSYRAALGVLTCEQDRTAWIAAKIGLGSAIVRLATETGKTDELLEAISALRAAREATADILVLADIEATLGRAYVLYAEETDDAVWLNDGVECLRRATAFTDTPEVSLERVDLNRKLASALWTLGEIAGDRRLLDEAMTVLIKAREEAYSLGEAENAYEIAKQLDKFNDVLSAMQRPLRHTTRDVEPVGAKILKFTAG